MLLRRLTDAMSVATAAHLAYVPVERYTQISLFREKQEVHTTLHVR